MDLGSNSANKDIYRLLNWAIAYSTPYMVDPDHANLQSKVFFIWGSFCFVCIGFV